MSDSEPEAEAAYEGEDPEFEGAAADLAEEVLSEEEEEEPSDEEAEDEGSEGEEAETASVATTTTRKISPQKQKVDPIARVSQTIRTKYIVAPGDRVTTHILQRAEAARLIAIRAEQIAKNPNTFLTSVPSGMTDAISIARAELLARRCPLCVERMVGRADNGDTYVERWDPNLMTHPALI